MSENIRPFSFIPVEDTENIHGLTLTVKANHRVWFENIGTLIISRVFAESMEVGYIADDRVRGNVREMLSKSERKIVEVGVGYLIGPDSKVLVLQGLPYEGKPTKQLVFDLPRESTVLRWKIVEELDLERRMGFIASRPGVRSQK